MSRPIITAESLSKAYRIGVRRDRSATLVGAAIGLFKSPIDNFRRLRRLNTYCDADGNAPDTYWALKDVSFEINEGEVVGIIGRNGAGKSTLLKLLSRITDPTSGRAVLRGRVSSLLEVGTGFHPELSGRENIYLNGTILGMTKREVDRKFDEIVEFAGVEQFLDTAIKRYSSGMSVRLAFAVAAHLEPEILIVDEVLAVGDGEFQKKCIGKMKDVARGGRTILFVSHNLLAVSSLCDKGIVLQDGKVIATGSASEMVHAYETSQARKTVTCWEAFNAEGVEFTPLEYHAHIESGEDIHLLLQVRLPDGVRLNSLAAIIANASGARLGIVDFRSSFGEAVDAGPEIKLSLTFCTNGWVEGTYFINWFVETSRFTNNVNPEWALTVLPNSVLLGQGAYPPEYRGFIDLAGISTLIK